MRKWFLVFILLIPFFLVLFWFRNGHLMGGGESGLPFYSLDGQYDISKFSWADPALGNSSGITVAAAPTFWLLSKLQNFGISGYVLEASVFWMLFVVSGIFIYLLTTELFPKTDGLPALLGVFFYWFNPFSLVNIWNRFLYNFMFFWAILPLAFFLFIKGIRNHSYKFLLLTSLSTFAFSYALSSMPFNLVLWMLFAYVIFFYFILSKSNRERVFLVAYFVISGITFVFLNAWWIGQLFAFVFSKGFVVTTTDFFTSAGNLSTLNSLSNSLGRLINIYRFMHGTFFIDGPPWAKIFGYPVVSAFGFLISGVVLWVMFRFRKVKEILLLGSLFLLSIFLTKGNSQPLGEPFQYVFVKIQALQVFRNPFEKFGFLIPLVSTPLFAFGVSEFLAQIRSIKLRRVFFVVLSILVVLLWGFPFWIGLVFTSNEGAKTTSLRTYEVEVPSYYKTAESWFSERKGDYRFVSLPLGGEPINYNWGKPYVGVELSSTLFTTPNISFNTTIPYFNNIVANISKYQINKGLLDFLPFINGRYIVWRSDIDFEVRQMANPSVIRDKLNQWVAQGDLIKRFEVGALAAYEVGNNFIWPKIYTTPNVYISNSKDLAFLSTFLDRFPETKAVVINPDQINRKLTYTKEIYVSEKTTIQKVSMPLPKNLTDEELLGKLFYANYLPGDWQYPFIRLNEKILEIREKDHDGWMLYEVGLLGKRVAEIYKLEKAGGSEKLIQKTKADYETEMASLSLNIEGLIQGGGPVAEVVKNSLIYQWELLGRASINLQNSKLADLLTLWGAKPIFELPVSPNNYAISGFEVPEAGKYFLSGISSNTLFVDGKKEEMPTDASLELGSGQHEISENVPDSVLFNDVLTQNDEIIIDQKSQNTWNFQIPDMPKTYEVNFDYRFIKGDLFEVKIVQDMEKSGNASFAQNISKNPDYHGWSHFSSEMVTSNGATSAYLTFNSSKENICEKLWWGWKECGAHDSQFSVEIKNLSVKEVEEPQMAIVLDKSSVEKSDTNVTFSEINPSLYKVRIEKKSSTPEVLVFSELFNSYWKAKYQDGTQIPESDHLLVNDYANGWVLARQGNYDMTIIFEPEKILSIGKLVSIVSVALVTFITIFAFFRKNHEIY